MIHRKQAETFRDGNLKPRKKSKYPSLHIVVDGSLSVMCVGPNGNSFEAVKLTFGDCFGYAELLNVLVSHEILLTVIQGVEYFGDVVASEGAKCLVVEDVHELISPAERTRLSEILKNPSNRNKTQLC